MTPLAFLVRLIRATDRKLAMLKRQLFKHLVSIPFLFILSPLYAATLISVWDTPEHLPLLNAFYFDHQTKAAAQDQFFFTSEQHKRNGQTFKLMSSTFNNEISHTRYKQHYQGIPIWGTELIVHHRSKTKVTGTIVQGLEKEIASIQPVINIMKAFKLSLAYIQSLYPTHQFSSPRLITTHKIIFIQKQDELAVNGQAKLAYFFSFFIDDHTAKQSLNPVVIVDAKNGQVLKYYDNRKRQAVGTGPGGNDISFSQAPFMPRGTNHYQFGNAIPALPALGFLPVAVNTLANTCTMATPIITLSSWDNVNFNAADFPVPFANEVAHPPFSYVCTAGSAYQNSNDNGFSPIVNQGFTAYSPNNDTFYFGDLAYQLTRSLLPDVLYPWGTQLPIRIYTHVGNYDNAGAYTPPRPGEETENLEGLTVANFPAQFIVGNGFTTYYPLSDSGTVGHELAHIFTAYASNLIYADQSGAVNEAYSDISGATLDWYLAHVYPWYGFNWAIGPTVSLPNGPEAGKPTRYMYNPPLDGVSIGNAVNYAPGMDVHHSSGVYNKAFYLAIALYGMNLYTAYQYFSYANINYWESGANYYNASCGVLQVALDKGQKGDFHKLVNAFQNVGVTCKVGLAQLTERV